MESFAVIDNKAGSSIIATWVVARLEPLVIRNTNAVVVDMQTERDALAKVRLLTRSRIVVLTERFDPGGSAPGFRAVVDRGRGRVDCGDWAASSADRRCRGGVRVASEPQDRRVTHVEAKHRPTPLSCRPGEGRVGAARRVARRSSARHRKPAPRCMVHVA